MGPCISRISYVCQNDAARQKQVCTRLGCTLGVWANMGRKEASCFRLEYSQVLGLGNQVTTFSFALCSCLHFLVNELMTVQIIMVPVSYTHLTLPTNREV